MRQRQANEMYWALTDACRDEQARLLIRTAQLRARPAQRDAVGSKWSPEEHAALRDDLRQHALDLADFTRRCLEAGLHLPV